MHLDLVFRLSVFTIFPDCYKTVPVPLLLPVELLNLNKDHPLKKKN